MGTARLDFLAFCKLLLITFEVCVAATETEVNVADHVIVETAVHLEATFDKIFNFVTYTSGMVDDYLAAGARVQHKNGIEMVLNFSADIEKMMAWKVQAVQRIAEEAEELMLKHDYNPEISFTYNNAKKLNEKDGANLTLLPDDHFYGLNVNTSNSSIHVPVNVYDEAINVLNPIKATEGLNNVFKKNYNLDPSLSWQYFGSSTGFLRQYPAIKWVQPENIVDTYDCRMRPWYIEAAASPKDLVILIDGSGSMTGMSIEIAKHVARNILDTLSDNDFFTIFRFEEDMQPLVPCFNNSLVPANLENTRAFKDRLQKLDTLNIANFTKALIASFDILLEYNRSGDGSLCNQAIMLITDGAPHNFEEIFNYYNQPARRVRIFTYMIGQELTNSQAMAEIACSNRGYYSHVSTIEEARDKVQEYVGVMARPLALSDKHIVIWTSVYADKEDPKMSDVHWENIEKERYKNLMRLIRKMGLPDGTTDEDLLDASRPLLVEPTDDFVDEKPIYGLMTTVACPVFDQRNDSKCIGCILGVAAADVPVEEIAQLTLAYKLGVNGYSFVVTNNGYILFHPDMRPVDSELCDIYLPRRYHDDPQILKQDYNSVDLGEVELPDDDDGLPLLRKKTIDREVNRTQIRVKMHLDGMRRVVTRVQEYFFAPLKDTPFSLTISMPKGYGTNEVVGKVDLKKLGVNYTYYQKRVLSLFEGDNWRIHPDWIYCRYLYDNSERPNLAPEEKLLHFLKKIQNWKDLPRVRPLPKDEDYSYNQTEEIDKEQFYCDWELVGSLVFDARVTKDFNETTTSTANFAHKNGVVTIFVATRSGLTRFKEFHDDGGEFILTNNAAIDELWYKRAVDLYAAHNVSLVFSAPTDTSSLPFDADSVVTITRAIFLRDKNVGSAPAAVAGLRMKRSSLFSLLMSRRESRSRFHCKDPSSCKLDCQSEYVKCYLLDDNGYVMISEDNETMGHFYGRLNYNVMEALVADGVYRKVPMIDHQGVCFDKKFLSNSASLLMVPIVQLKHLLSWIWSKILFFYVNYSFYSSWNNDGFFATGNINESIAYHYGPRPCDMEYNLYELQFQNLVNRAPHRGYASCPAYKQVIPYVAHVIRRTNLLLLVVNVTAPCPTPPVTLTKTELNSSDLCHGLGPNIDRRRLEHCVSYHEQELEIEGQCGGSSQRMLSRLVMVTSITVLLTVQWLHK